MHRVYHQTMVDNPDALFTSAEEALEKMMMMTREKTLVFAHVLNSINHPNHHPMKGVSDAYRGATGLAFQRDSEFTKVFNHHLIKMIERGVLNGIKRRWKKPDLFEREECGSKGVNLGYGEVGFPFMVVLIGAAISAIVVLHERVTAICLC
jgi:hypothetical protein